MLFNTLPLGLQTCVLCCLLWPSRKTVEEAFRRSFDSGTLPPQVLDFGFQTVEAGPARFRMDGPQVESAPAPMEVEWTIAPPVGGVSVEMQGNGLTWLRRRESVQLDWGASHPLGPETVFSAHEWSIRLPGVAGVGVCFEEAGTFGGGMDVEKLFPVGTPLTFTSRNPSYAPPLWVILPSCPTAATWARGARANLKRLRDSGFLLNHSLTPDDPRQADDASGCPVVSH